jgi:Prealbumin-like fold domain
MITPNPFTLNHSLVVTDDKEADSDPTNGIILLKNVRLGSYIINETKPPPGFGPILLKTRVAVHQTDPNPVVTIENRNLDVPFEGTAIVTPPSLNDSSFKTFVSKGATVGTDVIKEVDALPPACRCHQGTTETEFKQETKSLQPVTLEDLSPINVSASEIFRSFKIPTYPVPVKTISSNITYLSPIFIIPQRDERWYLSINSNYCQRISWNVPFG